MAQHNLRYSTILLRAEDESPHQAYAEFSDAWYVTHWRRLFTLKESDTPGSKENVTQLAKRACEDYIVALQNTHNSEFSKRQEENIAKEGGVVLGTVKQTGDMKLPSCSVMLATDSTVYLALDFPDWASALNPANDEKLPPTVGRMFDNTGYDGQVLIRSSWATLGDSPFRVYYILPLRGIEFAYEEMESGLREEFDGGELLRTEFEANGQMKENTFEPSILANPAVVRYAPGAEGTMVVDMTDGSEWKVSKESFDRCSLQQGDKIDVSTLLISGGMASFNGPPVLSKQKAGQYCKLTAGYVRAW